MHKIRAYVDTSVFGGVFDEEFSVASQRFFKYIEQGKYLLLISKIIIDELSMAPKNVQDVLKSLPKENISIVPVKSESKELAESYIQAGALGKASFQDAFHVACATVEGADLILSWNFKHIVNYERIRKFNSVNIANGYRQIEIRSPLEIGDTDEEEI